VASVVSFSLTGRVALVTGGAGRLGRVMCRALAEAGARVLVNGRDRVRTETFADDLCKSGYTADALVFDVTDYAEAARRVGQLERLDVLVNNAASVRTGTIAATSAEAFSHGAASVVDATFNLVKSALPSMRRQERGSIVNISSMYGLVSPDPRIYGDSGFDSSPQYGAAKAGLLQLTRYLACHLAPDGIRVNSVSPGPLPDRELLAKDHPKFLAALEAKVPLRRVGCPEEVAGAVLFLAADASSYVTGANIPVDGGWTAW